jgi:hypothetical protein
VVTQAERLESINRINILERGEESVARGDITQKQFDESLKIFNKTKSMDAANEYLRKQRKDVTDKDAAIMKSEKARRARAKNKAKPMGKKKGGLIIAPKSGSAHYKSKKSSKAIAKKYFKGTF